MLFVMADAALERGDYVAARAGHAESLALFRSIGDLRMSTSPLISLGRIACFERDFVRARALVDEALSIRRHPEFGNPWQPAVALNSLGEVGRCAGDAVGAAASFEQALSYGRELGDDMIVAWSLHNLGHLAVHSGQLSVAGLRFRESLLLRWAAGPSVNVAASLAGLAGVALRSGAVSEAALVFGAVDGMLELGHGVLPPADEQVYRDDRAATQLRLGDPPFAAALDAGRKLSFDDLDAIGTQIALGIGEANPGCGNSLPEIP
jgi:hypothetical protein